MYYALPALDYIGACHRPCGTECASFATGISYLHLEHIVPDHPTCATGSELLLPGCRPTVNAHLSILSWAIDYVVWGCVTCATVP